MKQINGKRAVLENGVLKKRNKIWIFMGAFFRIYISVN